jgi:hypothetical protein
MVALAVIVLFEMSNRLAQWLLAKEDHAFEALRFQTSVEPLQVCIQIGRSRRQQNWLNAGLLQHGAKLPGELAVPIHEDITLALQKAIVRSRQIPCHLLHPGFFRARRAAGEVHAPCGHLHDKEQVHGDQTLEAPDLDGRKVHCRKHITGVADTQQFTALMEEATAWPEQPEKLAGDKGYAANSIRDWLKERGIPPGRPTLLRCRTWP